MSEPAPPRKGSKHDRARPPTWRSYVIIVSTAAALCVYLFVNAPAPLAAQPSERATVPIRTVFAMLDHENQIARAIWTEDIVNRGTAAGLAFDERWRDEGVHAGPLPALFLRETARNLERTPLRLRLFLGSPHPINAANQLTGEQSTRFAALERSGAPQHFFERSTRLYTAMFADLAIVDACVRCHNEHKDSPKIDWELNAIMGATTWMYPDEVVTAERALEMIGALRTSIRAAYAAYLTKVSTFPDRPTIGTKWPKDGFHLPSEAVFMRELARRTSTVTLLGLLDPHSTETAISDPVLAPRLPPAKPTVVSPPPTAEYPTLVIRSAHSTKVTVERAGGRLLVARLLPGGSTSLSSRPPLRVQISDPEGVEIEYDGNKVELPTLQNTSTRTEDLEITVGRPVPEKS